MKVGRMIFKAKNVSQEESNMKMVAWITKLDGKELEPVLTNSLTVECDSQQDMEDLVEALAW